MRLKMLNTESGQHPNFPPFDSGHYHCLKGHEYEVPDDLAGAWVAQGIAERVVIRKKPPTQYAKVGKPS